MTFRIKSFIFKLSAILILIATTVYTFNKQLAAYVMIVGVVGFTVSVFMSPYPGKSLRGKRLYNMQIFGVLFMIMSSYLMFEELNQWVIPMLIAGVLISYSSFILPKVYNEENKEQNK